MKRLMRALAMAFSLCVLVTGALAVDATIIPDLAVEELQYRVVTDVAVVSDTAYFRVYTHDGEEIWHWREGMAEAEKAVGGLVRASDYPTMEAAEAAVGAEQAKHAIVSLFSDGERLMGLNHLNGLIFEIGIQDGRAVFTDVVTLQANYMFYRDYYENRWYWSPNDVAVSGDYFYWSSSGCTDVPGETPRRITRFSLTDGSFIDIPAEKAQAICAYGDGDLLILSGQYRKKQEDGTYLPYRLCVYDPDTGAMTEVGSIDGSESITRIAWAPELDAVLYQAGTSIRGVKGMSEDLRYAYVNTTGGNRLAVVGDSAVVSNVSTTLVRTLVEGMTAQNTLQVIGSGSDAAAKSFMGKHPTVPVEFQARGEDYVELLKPREGEENVDVIRLNTANSDWEYTDLAEAGMLMDLSGDPEIRAYVDALYPPFRELVTGENGEIWAVPTEAISYTGFFINRNAMADIGLTVEELPTNMIELCEFVTRWDREFAEKYPNYACIEYTENTRWYLLDMTVEMWIAHCQATGREVRFDDPVFRELMAALEKVETTRTDASMQTENPEVSDYKQGLFWMRCQLVGNWAAYMEDYSDRIFVPFTLTEETPLSVCVDNVELWAVNVHTESPEYTLKLLHEEIASVSDKYAHVLLTTRTEPVESPFYPDSLEYEQKRLADMKAELETEMEEAGKVRLHERIEKQQRYIDTELKRSMYTVTPSAIENYVNVLAPAMYIHRQNVLENTDAGTEMVDGLVKRWAAGELTAEQFIHEAEMRLLMLEKVQ